MYQNSIFFFLLSFFFFPFFFLHLFSIVDPRCDFLSEGSRQLAVGSVELLENAKVFPTLEACVADLQKVYATTARNR